MYKVSKCLNILGFNEPILDETKMYILDEITKYIFNTSQTTKSSEKVFDYELDYKYYYCDFLKLGIDLNKDIDWWKFDVILEGTFLSKDSVIGQVIQYRTYEKPTSNIKSAEAKENKFYMDKKRQYALPQERVSIEENLNRLWNYVEKKAGDIDE